MIKVLEKCYACGTKKYRQFLVTDDCPGCHGESEEIVNPAPLHSYDPREYLCMDCFTIWQQGLYEQPECPSCGKEKHNDSDRKTT